MQTKRRLRLLFLAFSFAILSLPVFAQHLIATVPVGTNPGLLTVNSVTNKIYVVNDLCNDNQTCGPSTVTVIDGASDSTTTVDVGIAGISFPAVNSVTNKIYVANGCGSILPCGSSPGTVTVIDGASNSTATVNVGYYTGGVAVNLVTNKIYVTNSCGNDPNCNSQGTVTVIDGATNGTTTVNVGFGPLGVAINPVTNKIYVANNFCANFVSCGSPGTVTVIDGVTNTTTTVTVGVSPVFAAVNSVTNKIYVSNLCGNDLNCQSFGTVTVIDGATNLTQTINAEAFEPFGIALNPVTNKIYVADSCGLNLPCGSTPGTVTVIDGATNNPTLVSVGLFPYFAAVDSVTNKIYVTDALCNKLERHVGLSCSNGPSSVTAIDGVTNNTTTVPVGTGPWGVAVNATTNKIYVPNFADNTVSVIAGASSAPQQFVPVTPCRLVDTRPQFGGSGPIPGGTSQTFTLPQLAQSKGCSALSSAAAYSLNVTVVPSGILGYLTLWPTGEDQPIVSTLNSLDGRIKAEAAIVPAGYQGAVSLYVTNTTNVILDIDGYFAPVSASTLAFYSLPPCRVADTRYSNGHGLGSPYLTAGRERAFPILNATRCNIPSDAAAYSLNFTVVPHGALYYMTVWPTGGSLPNVSTLNDIPGAIIANAAIVPAGDSGKVSVQPSNDTDLVIDINGYFATAGTGGLSLYPAAPCRVLDTRGVGRGLPFSGTLSPPVDVVNSACGPAATAQAYVFNATVVPQGALGYLTLWPDGENQPVSTLNALDGSISSNMAIVPTNNGKVDAYASGITQLILDISSYFAP